MTKKRNSDQTGSKNPFWKGGKTRYDCGYCGKEFFAYPRKDRGDARFCCYECSREHLKKRAIVICEVCGEKFETKIYEIERGKSRFCSRDCGAVYCSQVYRGANHHMSGVKFSDDHRRKISDANSGEKSHRWNGGVTIENRRLRKNVEYKIWREKVFERDDYTCQRCLTRGGYLEAHHIIEWAIAPEERYEVDNGATLCIDCHNYIHSQELRVDNSSRPSYEQLYECILSNSGKAKLGNEHANPEPSPLWEGVETRRQAPLVGEGIVQTTNISKMLMVAKAIDGTDPRLLYLGDG